MEQHTLVAFYGKKQDDFKDLIKFIWEEINSSSLNFHFLPYDLAQIHSTIIGLEKIPGRDRLYNLNIWEKEGRRILMDLGSIGNTLKDFLPINLQFGGFPEDFEEFRSLGKPLFERSFEIDWSSGKVVLIGWPVDSQQQPSDLLLQLRQSLYQQHQVLHKYEGDTDFYLVLGRLQGLDQLNDLTIDNLKSVKQELEENIRTYLSGHPYNIQLELDHLSVVRYTDTTLPPTNSQSWPLGQIDELF